jgi:patatin-like phospholipase/acyl hydrolase
LFDANNYIQLQTFFDRWEIYNNHKHDKSPLVKILVVDPANATLQDCIVAGILPIMI